MAQHDDVHAQDVKHLHSMGYAQELSRRMGAFQNFAISFSIICILAGGIGAYTVAFGAGGGGSIGIGWIVGSVFALLVAAAMGQIASAYPTAGGLYHWASILGGRGYGWVCAWINMLGLVFVVASVNVGVYLLFKDLVLTGVFGSGTSAPFLVYTDQIMLEFVAGMMLARLYELGHWGSRRLGHLLLGIGVLSYALLAVTGVEHPRLLAWGIPAFLVVAGLLAVELSGGLFRSRLLNLTGDASYSIYLTHGIIISLLGKAGSALPSFVLLALCLLVPTAVGIVIWWSVERPLTRAIQGMISRSRAPKQQAPVILNQTG